MDRISDLITKLDSGFPWVRNRALNNLVEAGLPAVKEIVVALDTPFMPICINEVSSSNQAEFRALSDAIERWPVLVDVLVKIGEPGLPELQNALHHSNPNVCITAMHAIGRIGHPSAVDLLLPYLQSKKPYERAWALGALGQTHSPRVFEILVPALDDESAEIKETAILALGEIGDTRALPKLEQIAKSDTTQVENYGLTIGHVAKDAIKKIRKKDAQK
jgi:HEAT repeat protein